MSIGNSSHGRHRLGWRQHRGGGISGVAVRPRVDRARQGRSCGVSARTV